MFMRTETLARRYVALPTLRTKIRTQGRLQSWVADRVHLSNPQMSLVVSGKRTVSEVHAHVIAALLEVDVNDVFQICSEEHNIGSRELEGVAA
jgi:hypothetical protein